MEVTMPISKIFQMISLFENKTFLPEQEQYLTSDISIRDENNEWIPVTAAITKETSGRLVSFSNGDTLKAADKHLVSTGSGCVLLETLELRDKIVKANGEIIEVSKIETIPDNLFYDLSVDSKTHLYQTANGIVNHNTEMARQLAKSLGIPLIKVDMSEYMEKHAVSKFIGSPPGYVGYGEGGAGNGILINAVDTNPSCVLLLDEIEKAHEDIFNVLLQIMDDARLTSSGGKTVNFRNVILIMTSNAGIATFEKNPLGFVSETSSEVDEKAIRNLFRPEFRNRLDSIVKFNKLKPENMVLIVDKFIKELEVLAGPRKVEIILTEEARQWLAKEGFDSAMGARPLARVINDHIKKPLSRLMLLGDLRNGGWVEVKIDNGAIKLIATPAEQAVVESSQQHEEYT